MLSPLDGIIFHHIQSSCWWRSRRAVLSKTRLVASVRAALDRHLFDCISIPERGASVLRHHSDWHQVFGGVAPQKRGGKKHIISITIILAPPAAAPPVVFARFFPGSAFCIAHRFAFSSTRFILFCLLLSSGSSRSRKQQQLLLESNTHGAGFHRDFSSFFLLLYK